jgi:tetratricopeptide (TPR) repeat protein
MTVDNMADRREIGRLLARGDTDAALEALMEAFRVSPDDPDLSFNIAALQRNAGRHDRALDFFRRALILSPGFPTAFGHATMTMALVHGPGPALELARRLACLMPLSPQIRALKAQYSYQLGDHPKVPAAARRSLVLDPGAAGLYRLMGLSEARLQRTGVAATALRQACTLQPDWADARLSLAGARFALGDFEAAHEAASRALALGAHRGEAALLRARAALALNRTEEADEYLAIAVVEMPERALDAKVARLTMNRADFEHYHAHRPEKDAL